MTAKPRADPPTCAYPVRGAVLCGAPATYTLPAGSAAAADAMSLCGQHAARFLGAAVKIP